MKKNSCNATLSKTAINRRAKRIEQNRKAMVAFSNMVPVTALSALIDKVLMQGSK